MRRTVTLLLLLASFASAQRADSDWIELARAKLAAGDTDAARDAIRKALERDEFSLLAIELEAKIAKQAGDNDSAVWALHRLIDVASASGREGAALARSAADTLAVLDTEATTWRQLKKRYLREVLAIAAEHEKKKRMHSALALFAHARAIDPHDPRPYAGPVVQTSPSPMSTPAAIRPSVRAKSGSKRTTRRTSTGRTPGRSKPRTTSIERTRAIAF
jgi:hypothetical protein